MNTPLPDKVVERLSLYRRLLAVAAGEGVARIFSHELADRAGVTAAQVRRDLMGVGITGSPAKGYELAALVKAIGKVLDSAEGQRALLVGVGNLGRAILAYFVARHPMLQLVAAFDTDPQKVGRVTHGCRSYPMSDLEAIVAAEQISVAILTVPVEAGQEVAQRVVAAGVRGILNFTPARIKAPAGAYVEDIDFITALEKVAYFARRP